MAKHSRVVIAAVWLSLAAFAAATHAQSTGQAAAPGTRSRLLLVVGAPKERSGDDLQVLFHRAFKKTDGFDTADVTVQAIPQSVYDSFKSIAEGKLIPDAVYAASGNVRMISGTSASWEINSQDPFAEVTKVKLYFDGKGETKAKEPVTHEAKPRNDYAAPFRYHAPGSYVLRLDGSDVPSHYELVVRKDGQKESVQPKQAWPQSNQYFLIAVEKFTGDPETLYASLKNNALVPNALTTLDVPASVAISLANFGVDRAMRDNRWLDKTHYGINEPSRPDLYPKRVWVYFPATDAEKDAVLKEYAALAAQGPAGRDKVLAAIHANCVRVEGPPTITVGEKPKWYELPESPRPPVGADGKQRTGDFHRVFDVAHGGEAPKLPADATIHGVYAFEFDQGEPTLLETGEGYVSSVPHLNWVQGLHKQNLEARTAKQIQKELDSK